MIFFPHIPKSGGFTLRTVFYNYFAQNVVIKVWGNKSADYSMEQFLELDKDDIKNKHAIIGMQ
jgi:hypothetical protein